MDFETWVDKNGTNWKVTEMSIRLIKKEAIEVDKKLRKLLNQPVKNISHYDYGLMTINFYFHWLNRFDTELKRRKQNGKL